MTDDDHHVTKTFTSKDEKHRSETRRIKKGWKNVFASARKLKESPIIPNYYDDEYLFFHLQLPDPLCAYDSDSVSDSDSNYVYVYQYIYQCCVCDFNEGHKARDNPDVYQQPFHQRKQARRSCDKWKREHYDYYYNESRNYYNENNSSDEDDGDCDWDESSYDSNSNSSDEDDGYCDWDESSYDSDSNSSDEDDSDCDWDESDNPNSNSSNSNRDWYYILLVAAISIIVAVVAVWE